MFVLSLLAASSFSLLATAQGDSTPFSKFVDDANSLIASATGADGAQLSALYNWQATQTAVPSNDVNDQYQDYLNAYMSLTSAPLPSWVTAVPSSLQPVATSFLRAEASLVVQDIAPIVSQEDVAASSGLAAQTTPTATSSSNNTSVISTSAPSATASSGFATGSANATRSQMSGSGTAQTVSANGTTTAPITSLVTASGSATKSVTPPAKAQTTSGAEKPASVAVVAAVVGILGMMVLL